MKDLDKRIFISLFKDVCVKCFGVPLNDALSESDCKLLSTKIFEQTGLVIGPKSLKNYSIFVVKSKSGASSSENPSDATLDTLSRFVLSAPYSDEIIRKKNESHFPYWFQYKSRFLITEPKRKKRPLNRKIVLIVLFVMSGGFACLFVLKTINIKDKEKFFTDNFNSVQEDSLFSKGWMLKSVDTTWWNKRNEKPGHLTLYTLRGDNWSLGENHAGIRNLLIRKITSGCFSVEIHLSDFFPKQNWQQAGILLSEDSTFTGKMIRLSISYNNYFGGYDKPAEIIIQGISSSESGSRSKPEEIIHRPLFSLEQDQKNLAENNQEKSALKIEKKGNHFRFLYSSAPIESFTFQEAASGDFNIQPKYVGIFSIQGWAENENYIPACFDSFSLMEIPCGN